MRLEVNYLLVHETFRRLEKEEIYKTQGSEFMGFSVWCLLIFFRPYHRHLENMYFNAVTDQGPTLYDPFAKVRKEV